MKGLFFPVSLVLFFTASTSYANDELGGGGNTSSQPLPAGRIQQVVESSLPDLSKGCESIGSCSKTNNRNRFDFSRQRRQPVFCTQDSLSRCSGSQKLVCSEFYRVKVCIDIELAATEDGTPRGNFTMDQCRSYCEGKGGRLLTNNEWLVAALGTEASNCLPAQVRRRPNPNSSQDMRNLDYNKTGIRSDRTNCVSAYGIKDMVGVLGQWVTDGQARSGRAQFNGGLWPQNQSTIFYRTTAHAPSYTDYSIGCRCATSL